MFRGTFWKGGPVLGAAISAIDIALWDLNAKALGVPAYRLLGGKSRDRVRCYAHLGDVDQATMVSRARALVADGWTVVRFAVLQDLETGVLEPRRAVRRCVEDFAAVREAVGPDVDIVVDFHVRLVADLRDRAGAGAGAVPPVLRGGPDPSREPGELPTRPRAARRSRSRPASTSSGSGSSAS